MSATQGSSIGKTIYISDAVPAINNSAGFQALTWTKVEGVQVLPQLGTTSANIDSPDLQTGFTSGVKGAQTGNESSMTFRSVPGDAGQALLRQLADAAGDAGCGSIRIVKGTGTDQAPQTGDDEEFAQGYFNAYLKNQGDTNTHEGFTTGFKQNALSVEATVA